MIANRLQLEAPHPPLVGQLDITKTKACTSPLHIGPSILPASTEFFSSGRRRGVVVLSSWCRVCQKKAVRKRKKEVQAAARALLLREEFAKNKHKHVPAFADLLDIMYEKLGVRKGKPGVDVLAETMLDIIDNGTPTQKERMLNLLFEATYRNSQNAIEHKPARDMTTPELRAVLQNEIKDMRLDDAELLPDDSPPM